MTNTTDTEPTVEQLLRLADKAADRVLTGAEHARLRAGIEQQADAAEQAELDAEQQARNFRRVCGERESYRQAWKHEQKQRATAEADLKFEREQRDDLRRRLGETSNAYGQLEDDRDRLKAELVTAGTRIAELEQQAEDLLRVAHETSNKSEAERAALARALAALDEQPAR